MKNSEIPKSCRLDQYLFLKGFFDSREKAKREILAGRVREAKSGTILDKPGMTIKKELDVRIQEKERFVSRAGDKLFGFVEEMGISFEGKNILDVGSSTGGFSDCALQRNACLVTCVDVGTHQLHEKIRGDSRVSVFEETDIRKFDFRNLPDPLHWILIDVSFISSLLFLELLKKKLPRSSFIILFKPQFEAPREVPRKKGIVSENDRKRALAEYLKALNNLGFHVDAVKDSLVKGAKGNQESFILLNGVFNECESKKNDDRLS